MCTSLSIYIYTYMYTCVYIYIYILIYMYIACCMTCLHAPRRMTTRSGKHGGETSGDAERCLESLAPWPLNGPTHP